MVLSTTNLDTEVGQALFGEALILGGLSASFLGVEGVELREHCVVELNRQVRSFSSRAKNDPAGGRRDAWMDLAADGRHRRFKRPVRRQLSAVILHCRLPALL